MLGLVLLEMDSVCVRFSFTRYDSVCQVQFYYKLIQCVLGLALLEMDSVCQV